MNGSIKIKATHLNRHAVVYLRQSDAKQVRKNRESAANQRALKERLLELNWKQNQISMIDGDQGKSAKHAEGREGFQTLVADVGLGKIGVIVGYEVSRLARNCADWHRLLELCALFDTLIGDSDGIYNPRDFNDRLLLGLKGTMSEAELHVLKSRMYQGRLNKADRGELMFHPPFGYVYNADKTGYDFDPDEQAQSVVRLLFAEFERQGTIYSLLRYLTKHDIKLPIRPTYGPHRGQLEWRRPNRTTLNAMLQHPTYAGAYRYGYRYHDPRKRVAGKKSTGIVRIPLEECRVLIKDRFPAYISWEKFENNRQRLAQNLSRAKTQGAPRRGPSLLGGLVYCGRCEQRLMVQYSGCANRLRYQCARVAQNLGGPLCQGITGHDLDRFATERIFKVLEPATLELSLAATADIVKERERLEQHWQQRVERANQNVDRCARQYQTVEPENRLVARTLEKNWEAALREQEKLRLEYEDFCRSQSAALNDEQRELIRNLSNDIPKLWNAPTTTSEDRQQIVRMLIDRIDLNVEGQSERTEVTITWAGGFTSRHQFQRTVFSYSQLSYLNELIARIIELKKACADLNEVATQINEEGYRPLRGGSFTGPRLSRLLIKQGIHSPKKCLPPKDALRENEWWIGDLAKRIGMPRTSLATWVKKGWVNGRKLRGPRGRSIVWADEQEISRLEQLRASRRRWSDCPFPPELTTPKARPEDAS